MKIGEFYKFIQNPEEEITKNGNELKKGRKKRLSITIAAFIFQILFFVMYIFTIALLITDMVKTETGFGTLQEESIIATTTTNSTSNIDSCITTTVTTTVKVTETKPKNTTSITTIEPKEEETETTTTTTTTEETIEYPIEESDAPIWNGEILNRNNGFIQGPSGTESYYNLPMQGVVSIMREMGFDEINYPYWEREDGVKMLGQYVMCAANLEIHPRGSVVQSSLGMALVCDTGGFIEWAPNNLDIAVNW